MRSFSFIRKGKKLENKRKITKKLMCIMLTAALIAAFIPGGFARPDSASADTIRKVNVYDVDNPEIGAHPDFTGKVPQGAYYHLATGADLAKLDNPVKATNGICWFHKTDTGEEPMTADETFVYGDTYRYTVILFPNEGHAFATATHLVVLLNNLGRLVNHNDTVINADKVVVNSVDITVKKSINKVDISNIDMPVAGCTPDLRGTLLKNCNYHMATNADFEKEGYSADNKDLVDITALYKGKAWFHMVRIGNDTPAEYDYIPMAPAEKFIAGKKYAFGAYYAPDDGYEFNKNGKCILSINGKTSLVEQGASGNEGNLMITFTKMQTAAIMPASKTLSLKLYGYNDIRATWSKVTGATRYKVEYYKAGSKTKPNKTVSGTSTKLANLTDGNKYYVKVTPCFTQSGKTYSGKSKSSSIYTLKKLNAPKISKKSSTKITVKWNNIKGETGYQISRSTKKAKTGTVLTVKTTTGSSKTLMPKKNRTYYYKVRAYKKVDGKKICGPWSSVKSYKLK